MNSSRMLNKLSIFHNFPRWALVTLVVLSGFISAIALRENNQEMIKLRSAVYEADRTGGDINAALVKLRAYVHSHMNTNLSAGNTIKPPLQLKHTYERLQAVEQERVKTVNDRVYTDAQSYCERQNPGLISGRSRVPCVEDYVTTHGVAVGEIPTALYQFDFVSPSWSPDVAGWSLVATSLLALFLLASLIADRLIRAKLNPL